MNMDRSIAWTLRIGIAAGLVPTVIGLLVPGCEQVLLAGIVIIVISPLLGAVVATFHLIRQKDRFWSAVALVSLAVMGLGVAATMLI